MQDQGLTYTPPILSNTPDENSAVGFLRVLERFGLIGYWYANLSSEKIYWSEQVSAAVDLPLDLQPLNFEEALSFIHSDDRDLILGEIDQSKKSGQPFHFKVRLLSKSGDLHWIESSGEVQTDEHGAAATILGTFRDITEEMENATKLQKAAEFHRRVTAAINEMQDAFVIFDSDDRLFLCNDAYKTLYPESAPAMKPGVLFEDMIRFGLANGQYQDAIGNEEEWLEKRMEAHRNPPGPIEQKLPGGRWSRVQEYIMSDGSTAGSRIDITEMKQLEKKLIEAAKEANSANRLKDRFLANMSHELRTPLNAIIGFSQVIEIMMLQEDTDRTKVSEYATDISGAGLHLLGIIEDIFSLAQMDADENSLDLAPVDIQSLLEDTRALTGGLTKQYERSLSLDANDCAEIEIIADKTKATQVLVNLVSNAIKYSGGGDVKLLVEPNENDHIVFKVIDTGPGIPSDLQGRIFDRFERLDATKQAIEGVGIGLAIAKDLVEAMNGEIGVDSTVGKGSTFWISLPRAKFNEQRLAG